MIDASSPTFRPHPLDGAMLFFHPPSGTHVRVETTATRALARVAPRVVMFGITNACNLRCDFCSRDVTRTSAWTVESAAEVLEGFARAGTLEVAFGGGEPFAFRGFEELLLRLHETTPLALHVTTNGTLIDDDVLARLRGILGQVRVSIYEGEPWRRAAQALVRAGQMWGANVLVDESSLATLPRRLEELAALSARDVSILSYVGADPALQLSTRGNETLAAIIRASPVPCRVSVCFGARLPVHRLWKGVDDEGDCGAGLDFLSITPDKRVQSCSFQDSSFPVETAEDALAVWSTRRDALRAPSPRIGCARTRARSALRVSGRSPDDEAHIDIRVWQSFSGNNSGECVLVSKFETAEDAEKLLAELVPGYAPGDPYGAPWKALFEREKIVSGGIAHGYAPDEMIAVGRAFIARTDSAPGDDFPELRALAWKRGGEVIAGGIHVHGNTTALGVVRAHDAKDIAKLLAAARAEGAVAEEHAGDVIIALTGGGPAKVELKAPATPLAWRRDTLKALAKDRPFAMELVFQEVDGVALTAAMKQLASPPDETPRLVLAFWGTHDLKPEQRAEELAKELEGKVTQVQNLVLVENLVRKKRLAVLGYRKNAWVTSLGGETVEVSARLWREAPPRTKGKKAPDVEPLVADAIKPDIVARLRSEVGPNGFELVECVPDTWGGRVSISVRTGAPAGVLTALAAYATAHDLQLWLGVHDTDALTRAIRRVRDDVAVLARRP